ncbi:MAG: hypothetical protein IJ308_01640, partial [Clostridia bacterium]|nr:hypothetical protein [Clostridia bacterium]
LYDSDYWSYDELIGYYNTLSSALSKVADTEIYNRVLAETMFARCALFDFYMDEYISAQGADVVAEELVQFQKDAQVCGFTYAYEGWYTYESSIAYKINAWKTNANLISALVENTEVIKDENYAKTEYSHLYSISVTEGLEFRTDGDTVALRHQGTSDALTVNSAFLNKMVNAGYTHVTVTATTNNGDNTLDVFKPGSTSEYLASSKTSAENGGKVTHTLALADLYDSTAAAYDLRIQTRGWWSGVTLTINELTFSGVPMTDEEIAAVIDDETTNWASSEYASLWSVGSPQTISATGETVVIPAYVGSSGFIISVSSQLMNAAVEAGYTTVTIVSTTNYHNNFRIFPAGTTSASSTTYLATAKTNLEDGGQVTYTIELSKLLNSSTGNYELLMQNGGWSSNSGCSVTYNSLIFRGKPIDPEVLLDEGLVNEDTNWASSEYATFWSVGSPQTIEASGDTVKIPAYVGSSGFMISVDSQLMNAAVAAGYTTATIISTTNYDNNFRIFPAGTTSASSTTYLATAKTNLADGGQVTYTIELSKLLNDSTGNYELLMQNGGWSSNSDCSVTYNSLTFAKPVDPMEAINEALKEETTNWALSEHATFWSVDSPQTIDATGEAVTIPAYVGSSGFKIYFDSEILNAAVEAGYTTVTIASTTNNYNNNFRIFKPGSSSYLTTTTVSAGTQATITVNLSDLLNTSTGDYELAMQNGGWWTNGGCSVTYNSLTFSTHYKTANFAESAYAEYWTATNASLTTSGETVSVKCASGYMLSVSGELLALAAGAGCTTVTISTNSGNFDNWFDIYNPNWANATGNSAVKAWKQLSVKPTEREVSWTLNLADLLNANGEYVLNMSARGWWSGCTWTVTSLTFA